MKVTKLINEEFKSKSAYTSKKSKRFGRVDVDYGHDVIEGDETILNVSPGAHTMSIEEAEDFAKDLQKAIAFAKYVDKEIKEIFN